jgi:hypothetical protein
MIIKDKVVHKYSYFCIKFFDYKNKNKKMTTDSTDNNEGNSFEYRLKEVSDEEIVSILRYREHYQPQAVKAAIREALKRGIISSLDELENEEFKSQPIPSKRLFPVSPVENQNISIFKSLCRLCYGFGIIPIIYGIFQIIKNHITMGIIALVVGLLVVFLTSKLEKEKKISLSQLLLFLNIPAIGFAVFRLSSIGNPSIMDFVVTVVVILILLYTTFYIHKLTLHFNKNL